MSKKLLLIEDNEEVRRQLRWGFAEEADCVLLAGDVAEALDTQRREKPQVVTLDLGLPPDTEGNTEGFRALKELLSADPRARVIVVTGHHDVNNALRSIRAGACDFCRKPVDLEELKVIVRRGFFLYELLAAQERAPREESDYGIICRCRAMRELLETTAKVAASDAPVLIIGESGTGKELVARAIHRISGRRNGPLVTVNCGAIPENLLEAEFFGHEKGAFTGATQRVQGKVEYADNGTLFLDEIGELPPHLQVKLLRFLQEMVIQRVGGRQNIPVNVRIIAATNVDISDAIRRGKFREDLYYRIGVVTIPLPPLREREDDVLLLAEHFVRKFDERGQVLGFSPEAERSLRTYAWPGNVRELENRVRRAIIFAGAPYISATELGLEEKPDTPGAERTGGGLSLREARNSVERELVMRALDQCRGNIQQAAQALGVSRPTFYDLLKKHNIAVS